jgi:predicted branched-subunit amino acid permease
MKELTYKNGLKDGIPIMLGYFAVSIAFGVTAVEMGVSEFIAVLISMTNLTSAGQLAGLSVIAVMGTVFEIILTQLVINARYFLMSLTLSQKLDGKFRLLDRFLCAFGITDEIFAVAVSKKQVSSKYIYGLITLPFFGWTIGTLLGALLGSILPKIIVNALSIALFSMFIAIIIPKAMEDNKVIIVVVISACLSCLFYFIPYLSQISSGISYIICALVASIIGAIFLPVKEEDCDE